MNCIVPLVFLLPIVSALASCDSKPASSSAPP
jgi:hypothetical protein